MSNISIADIGGNRAKAIATQSHRPNAIEKHIDAMMMLLMRGGGKQWNVDELRRAMEELAPAFYEGSAYYERWVSGMRDLLLEKGLISDTELQAKLRQVRARAEQKET